MWLHTHNVLPISYKLDFTNIDYTGEPINFGQMGYFKNTKVAFLHQIVKFSHESTKVKKGYWVATKEHGSQETTYDVFSVNEDGVKNWIKIVLDRGDLLHLKTGDRYKKVE